MKKTLLLAALAAFTTVGAADIKKAPTATQVYSEDFSLWTSGSEAAPDTTDMAQDSTALNNIMHYPGGWTGLYAYQAGGAAYFGYDNEHGPGYLLSGPIDLRGEKNQGVFRIKFRVKNLNENAQGQSFQIFTMDLAKSQMRSAKPFTLAENGTWTDVEMVSAGGTEQTGFMFFAWKGLIVVDDMTVETLVYALDAPENVKLTMASANGLTATWDAVEGATKYDVAFVKEGDTVGKMTVNTTTATCTLGEAIVPGETYSVMVTASDDNGNDSYYGGASEEFDEPGGTMTAPVALEGTYISGEGFTANWQQSDYALGYAVKTNWHHEVTDETEEFTYINEDFSNLPETGEEESLQIMGSLDNCFSYGGWTTDLALVASGLFCTTNMYKAYGFPGTITSPKLNFSNGGGKVNVSVMACSYADDAVLGVQFLDASGNVIESSKQTIELAPMAPALQTVQLEGGVEGGQIAFTIDDAAESGDLVVWMGIVVGTTLNHGEIVDMPWTTVQADYDQIAAEVAVPWGDKDYVKYTVTGIFNDEYQSEESNEITVVKNPTAIKSISDNGAQAFVSGGQLFINNPANEQVSVYQINGSMVQRPTTAESLSVSLQRGTYIVKVGSKLFKVRN